MIPIKADDIFDLIPEDILHERFGFPGHAAARALAAREGRPWKRVYRDKWGIDVMDISVFEMLGREMITTGRVPRELTAILEAAVQLADAS